MSNYGPTVEDCNRGKQETKGNLKGDFWSFILVSAILNYQQIIKKKKKTLRWYAEMHNVILLA